VNSCADHCGIFLALGALLTLASSCSPPPEPLSLRLARQQFPITSGSLEERGAATATTLCRSCHEDGVFRSWRFRYHSTLSGEPPTRADLRHLIEIGVPGTTMNGYQDQPEKDREALALWLLHEARVGRLERLLALRARAGETLTAEIAAAEAEVVRSEFDNDDRAVKCPPEPVDRAASARAGAALYHGQPALCLACHGATGRGDGPRAAELRDDAEKPAPARDFTTGVFRGGSRGEDLFRRIKCGVGGTPMPSFAAMLSDEQIWNLVHFVQSLAPR